MSRITDALIAHYKFNENTAGDNAELVTDGDMDVAGSWTPDGTWAIADGVASGTGDGTSQYLQQNLSPRAIVGRRYRISYEIIANTLVGFTDLKLSGGGCWDHTTLTSTVGIHSIYLVSTQLGDLDFRLVLSNESTGGSISVDNISVKLFLPLDSSGNGNDGLAQQDTDQIHQPGKINGAFDFDGAADYIEIADADTLDATVISISAWVNLDAEWASSRYLAAKLEDIGGEGNEISYGLIIRNDRKVGLLISDTGDYLVDERTIDAISVSTWHHVVGTYDGAGNYKIYIDGNLATGDGNGAATGNVYVGTGRLILGARYDAGDAVCKSFFDGLIDNVMFFSVELTQEEVDILYNAGHGTEIIAELDSQVRPRRGNLSKFPLRRRYEF